MVSNPYLADIRTEALQTRAAFLVCTVSSLGLLLTVRFGTIAPAVFIGLWMLYLLAWPRSADHAWLRILLPWILPLFALASTAWSMAPEVTERNATEWLIMSGIGILMASVLPMERLLAAWMLALIPVVVIGGIIGGNQFTETGEVAYIGVFGSKNNFALHISEMLLVCTAVLANSRQNKAFRLMALFGCVVGPVLLWLAKSVGALAVCVPSLLLMCGIILVGRMRPHLRQIAIAGLVVIGMAVVATTVPIAIESRDTLFSAVGKTGDLTGRGLLWQRATVLSEQRPLLGVGYSAFWVQGNPEAEALWRAEHIPARGGFHFHSFYYETLVELGYLGLAIGVAVLALTSVAALGLGLRRPGPETGFFCAIMLFLCLRSFVELDLAGGFDLNALVLPVVWTYARSELRRVASIRHRLQAPCARQAVSDLPWSVR